MDSSTRKRVRHYYSGKGIAIAACAMIGLTCSGCFALAVGVAGGAAGAVYVLGKLTDEVNYDVPVVHAAATQAMSELGLKPSEDRADKLTAHIKSEFADGTNVWIDGARPTPWQRKERRSRRRETSKIRWDQKNN